MTSENTLPLTFEDWTLRLRPPQGKPVALLLMLHGWTGDENSMWSFARNLPANWWILAPRAPYPAAQGGYSWRAPVTGGFPSLEQLQPSAAALMDLLERWGIANGMDTARVHVIGFSQGGALAVTMALTRPERLERVGVLAGFAPLQAEAFIPSAPLAGKRLFWAHGTQDQMVSMDFARRSVQTLEQCGGQVQFCEAEVGHKVSADCLRRLHTYLTE
jgi:phospholipase/carboxylesterase